MVWFTEQEWKKTGSVILKLSPYLLLIVVVLFIGFVSGHDMASTEISKDCKYAQSFRVGLESFTCQRRL